jgi:hemerythrin
MTGRTFNVGGREVKPGITRYNFQEAFQDSNLAVKKLQQVVERHFGIKLPTRENAWMYENRLSSINMHERKSFIDKVYEPMMKIADAIMKEANAEGVGVVIKAKHLCMMMRGVEKQNSEMVTSAVLGSFRSDEKVRGEFLSLVNG